MDSERASCWSTTEIDTGPKRVQFDRDTSPFISFDWKPFFLRVEITRRNCTLKLKWRGADEVGNGGEGEAGPQAQAQVNNGPKSGSLKVVIEGRGGGEGREGAIRTR